MSIKKEKYYPFKCKEQHDYINDMTTIIVRINELKKEAGKIMKDLKIITNKHIIKEINND